jgi:hypothetical protein
MHAPMTSGARLIAPRFGAMADKRLWDDQCHIQGKRPCDF